MPLYKCNVILVMNSINDINIQQNQVVDLMNNKSYTNYVCLSDIAVTSFEDLVLLSIKSNATISKLIDIKKEAKTLLEFKLNHDYESMSNNLIKIYITLNALNEEQKIAFNNIHKSLSEELYSVHFIDAAPGTGKTFTIASIVLSLMDESNYIVYSNNLQTQLSSIRHLNTTTCCKFIMKGLQMNYYQSMYVWNTSKHTSFIEAAYALIKMVNEFLFVNEGKLYILDEYTIVSPWFIVFLYALSIKYHLHILFIGDRFQQNSINKSIYHSKSNNYKLLQMMTTCNQVRLTQLMRQDGDDEFKRKIQVITQLLRDNDTGTDVHMNFHIKYALYEEFADNFTIIEDFNSLFMSQLHIIIKARNLRFIKYLERNKIAHKLAYLAVPDNNGPLNFKEVIKPYDESGKFLPFLPLVKGHLYLYQKKSVKFIGILPNKAQTLLLQDVKTSKYIKIVRERMSCKNSSTEELEFYKNYCNKTCILQYPLKLKTSTFHAAQGLTIENDVIEMNVDTDTLNSIYVGITRIKALKQLGRLHSKDFLNLCLTKHFNDEYFYAISLIDALKYKRDVYSMSKSSFKTVTKISNFKTELKSENRNTRILKSVYISDCKIILNHKTELMKFVEFLKTYTSDVFDLSQNAFYLAYNKFIN